MARRAVRSIHYLQKKMEPAYAGCYHVSNFLNKNMKPPQPVAQGAVARLVQMADAAWEQRHFQPCFELMEQASRLDPANFGILLNLGQRYGLRYDYAAAERCFEQAVRVAKNRTHVLTAAGELSDFFANPKLPEQYFQKALEQKDAPAETFAKAAEFYERLRRMEEASTLLDRALQLDPKCGLAWLARARLLRHAGNLEEAEKVLRPILTTAEREVRIRGYYELGAILDRQARYDEAMTAFLEAKKILLENARPMIANLLAGRAVIRPRRADIKAEAMQGWFDARAELQPFHRLALLAGHARSGTTLLEQVLDSHPDIISAEETEIFMDDAFLPLRAGLPPNITMFGVLKLAQTSALRQSRERYFRTMELHLNQSIGSRLLLDKNPTVTYRVAAFARIFPEAKILLMLRDPRDVVMSCFMQPYLHIEVTGLSYLTLDLTVDDYTFVMEAWKAHGPLLKNPCLEVRYEDTVADLESVSRRVLDFLGVSWDASVLKFDEHARTRKVKSPTYADVTQPVYKRAQGRWRNYEKYLKPYLHRLEPFVKEFGYE